MKAITQLNKETDLEEKENRYVNQYPKLKFKGGGFKFSKKETEERAEIYQGERVMFNDFN